MTKRVQRVRHDNAGANTFQGKEGEIAVNLGNNSLHVHNGVIEGGTELARADLNNVSVATSGNSGKMSPQQVSELAQALIDIATNVTAIALNTANINSNDTDIATNVTNIATNVTNILLRASKIVPASVGNIATLDAAGDLTDSGFKFPNVNADILASDEQINFLVGVTSLIQTQLDAKSTPGHAHTLSDISDSGALAALSTVSAAEIDANSVGDSELKTAIGSSGTELLSANGTWTPSAGFYNWAQYAGNGTTALELFAGGSWRTMSSSENSESGFFWADGTNMRIKETSNIPSANIAWQKLG